jgi:hypothetical protein
MGDVPDFFVELSEAFCVVSVVMVIGVDRVGGVDGISGREKDL